MDIFGFCVKMVLDYSRGADCLVLWNNLVNTAALIDYVSNCNAEIAQIWKGTHTA